MGMTYRAFYPEGVTVDSFIMHLLEQFGVTAGEIHDPDEPQIAMLRLRELHTGQKVDFDGAVTYLERLGVQLEPHPELDNQPLEFPKTPEEEAFDRLLGMVSFEELKPYMGIFTPVVQAVIEAAYADMPSAEELSQMDAQERQHVKEGVMWRFQQEYMRVFHRHDEA